MSELEKVSIAQDRPIIATITGAHGSGKTSLAATFPKPIFIRVEDGMQSIPVDQRPASFERVNGSVDKLFAQLTDLATAQHDYKTVVIDTVSALENDFINHVMAMPINKGVKSINQACGGYGAGPSAVAALHDRVRKAGEYLNNRGMHVLFLAHADTTIIDLPDSEPYTQYTIAMAKKSALVYLNFADMVAQCKLEAFVQPTDGDKAGKIKTTGNRVISCHSDLSTVNKNRYGITQQIPFILGENPFSFLPIFNNANLGTF